MRTTTKTLLIFLNVILIDISERPAFSITEGSNTSPVKGLIRFTENKGQWNDLVSYRADVRGGTVFLEKKGFTYAFINGDDMREIHPQKKETPPGGFIIRMHSVKVQFENALEPLACNGSEEEAGYSNYFYGDDPSRWASNVKTFQEVSYQRIYEGVDMRVYSNYSALKYDFIVAAGAVTNQIRLNYSGADAIILTEEGHLSVHTSVGNFTEQKPYAYQIINGHQQEVKCNYALDKNVLSFDFPKGYNRNYELIIDPTLIFSTLTGSTADNWGNTATYDDLGNFYTGGIALAAGYPTTAGAYQTTFAGGGNGGNPYPFDIAISKYNPTGTIRLYATYLGGSNNEQPTSLVANKNGELYILGRTYSNNFPTTPGAFDRTSNGGCDIFIAKLSSTGSSLLASTYVGGSGDDGVNISATFATTGTLKYSYCDDLRSDIYIDDNEDVYVAGSSRSTNFPVLNATQPTLSGAQDGVVFKMDKGLTSQYWSTYIGGNNLDAAYSIVLDNASNVVVCGGTNSSNLPVTPGAYHATNSGGVDGFIVKFANNGSSILACTYVGTNSFDESWLVQTDKNDYIYVVGSTEGVYPVSGGVYSNANSSQFIHKFNPALTTTSFSTVFGSGTRVGNISITAFLVDICENLYVAGWGRKGFYPYPTTSVIGMPITGNAYQSNAHNGNDFYFIQIEKNANSLLYATYFGGANSDEHVDGGTSRFDKNGTIYQSVCAACGGYANDFPTTPGVVSTKNGSSNCNNGSIKMHFDFNLIRAVFNIPPINKGCAPFNVSFNNTTIMGVSYLWTFGDGDSSTQTAPSHIYTTPGTYTVRLVGTNINTCNVYDTAYAQVIVYPPPTPDAGPDKTICSGKSTSLTATGGTAYTWSPTVGLNPANTASPVASPSSTTNYVVTVTDVNGCTAIDSAMVFVDPLPPANAGPDKTICIGSGTALSASGGTSYVWNADTTLSNLLISNPVASPSATTDYIVTVTDAKNCSASDTVTVIVNPDLTVFVSPPDEICKGATSQITASGGATYSWSPGTGLSNPNISNPVATPNVTTTYSLYVTETNGCKGTGTTTVTVNQLPVVTISRDTTVCIGTVVPLTSSGGTSYSWSPATYLNNDTIYNPTATASTGISYQVLVTDGHGCTATKSVSIILNPGFTVNAGPDQEICVGESVQLFATGTGTFFSWSPPLYLNSSVIQGPVSTPTSSITYEVVTSSSTTCPPASDSVTIIVHPIPLINVSSDTTIMAGTSVSLTATGGGATYQWFPSKGLNCTVCPNPLASPLKTTTYIVITTDTYGCVNRDTVTINVDDILTLYVPTAFTPYNYDQKNSVFYAYGVGIWQFEFYIYDRWGTLVFSTNDPLVGWDGVYNGAVAAQDVYVWVASAKSITGKSISKTGAVMLLK